MEITSELHLLEQVASEEHIGTMAENLLEAMTDNPACKERIKQVRQATREEKKRKAMAMRAKELGALGMQVRLVCLACQTGACKRSGWFVSIAVQYPEGL